jgi:hypothetical protein
LYRAVDFSITSRNLGFKKTIVNAGTNLLFLVQVQALSEEKEAHEGFLSMRHRQQDEEQHQFRKAWRRRRSSSGDEETQQSAIETANRLGRLRRLPRYGYSGQRLGMTGSTALAVEG